MALQVEVLGLSADALMLIQQIDQKHIQKEIADKVDLGTFKPEFERRMEEKKAAEVIDKLIAAFKYFADNSTISNAEYSFVKDALHNAKLEIAEAANVEAIMGVLAPVMPKISSIIDKIMAKVGLMPDAPTVMPSPGTIPQKPAMVEVFEAMEPIKTAGPNSPPQPSDVALVNTNMISALRRALPHASAEMIDHLFAIIQGPIMGLGAEVPDMHPGSSSPSFGGGSTSVVGVVKKLAEEHKTADFVYGVFPPEGKGAMPFARLKTNTDLSVYVGKWVEFEGTFDPTISPAGFTVSKLAEASPVADPQKREMSFSEPLNKTNATPPVYYLGHAEAGTIAAGGRIKLVGELMSDEYVGKWVNIKGHVTKWAASGAAPEEVKVTNIEENESFIPVSN